MNFKKNFQQLFWVIVFFLIVSVLYTGALETTGKSDNGRADVISIQMAGGKSQMLAVMFLHDLHTASLENQDCSTCHLKDDDKQYSFKFMRTVDFDYEVNMTVYHENCIGCHNRMKSEGKFAGPDTGKCRACHNQEANVATSWADLDFDRSLHYRHESAQAIKPVSEKHKNNCGACHHEYDKKSRKTVYVPGPVSIAIRMSRPETFAPCKQWLMSPVLIVI
jgi:cytochrome c553